MKTKLIIILTIVLLMACNKDDGPAAQQPDPVNNDPIAEEPIVPVLVNNAPDANAGDDLHAEIGSIVKLDASASKDSEGDELTYTWSFLNIPEGSVANIMGLEKKEAEFTMDRAGDYEVTLLVGDGNSEVIDTVVVSNMIPILEIIEIETDPKVEDSDIAQRGEVIEIYGKFFSSDKTENIVTIGGVICEIEEMGMADGEIGLFYLVVRVADEAEQGELILTVGTQSTTFDKPIRLMETPVNSFISSDHTLVETKRRDTRDTFWEVGMTFKPLVNGQIVAIGFRTPGSNQTSPGLSLWEVENKSRIPFPPLTSASDGYSWIDLNILNGPIPIQAGKEYRFTMRHNDWYYHGRVPREDIFPRTYGNIEIMNTVTSSQPYTSNTDLEFPDVIVENYLMDVVDIAFVPDVE